MNIIDIYIIYIRMVFKRSIFKFRFPWRWYFRISIKKKRNLSSTDETPDDNELKKYKIHLDNVSLGYYVKDILDYIEGYIARSIIKKRMFKLYSFTYRKSVRPWVW